MHGFLKGKIVPVSSLSESDRKTMYHLMIRYYDHVRWDRFIADLEEKQDVILLLAGENQEIKGFSTLMHTAANIEGRKVRAIFSGDTVVDEAYWGQRVLGRKFLGYLFWHAIKQPFSPLYWLLISKGYKTYLLMANNFREHYPRHEKPTPARQQQTIDIFGRELFGDSYCSDSGCCKFPESLGQLKSGVAELSQKDIDKNPRIRFFVKSNPGWSKGDELVCIARMTLFMPFYYLAKSWIKLMASATNRQRPVAESEYSVEETTIDDKANGHY